MLVDQILGLLLHVGCLFCATTEAAALQLPSTKNAPAPQALAPSLSPFFSRLEPLGSELPVAVAAATATQSADKPSPLSDHQQVQNTATTASNAVLPPEPTLFQFRRVTADVANTTAEQQLQSIGVEQQGGPQAQDPLGDCIVEQCYRKEMWAGEGEVMALNRSVRIDVWNPLDRPANVSSVSGFIEVDSTWHQPHTIINTNDVLFMLYTPNAPECPHQNPCPEMNAISVSRLYANRTAMQFAFKEDSGFFLGNDVPLKLAGKWSLVVHDLGNEYIGNIVRWQINWHYKEKVLVLPKKPKIPVCGNSTAVSINVSWDYPLDEYQISSFNVIMVPVESHMTALFKVQLDWEPWLAYFGLNMSHVADKLIPGTEYSFQLQAVNAKGVSQWSKPCHATTKFTEVDAYMWWSNYDKRRDDMRHAEAMLHESELLNLIHLDQVEGYKKPSQ